MNAVVPLTPPGLVPANMTEAMRLADMMATAKLVPAGLQKSPADCLMVIQQAIRWDMDPFAVAQECSVIQGKLMHSGKLVAAVVNARGNLAERLSFTYDGNGDARTVTVSGRLKGEASARTVSVRLGEAKTNNKVWQTQPDQQLAYHGARVWARRHTPELMLGVYSPEEFDEPKREPPKPAPNVMLQPLPPHDAETGEMRAGRRRRLRPCSRPHGAVRGGCGKGMEGAENRMGQHARGCGRHPARDPPRPLEGDGQGRRGVGVMAVLVLFVLAIVLAACQMPLR